MYTYKLGGMLITDELYHDDLEAVTFGRKDQNELMHYGIKGQSWGKRRFQNEDGSLTAAGRNRYDVGAPLTGTTAANMSKNLTYKTWNGSSNGYGGAGGGGGSIRSNGSPTTRTYGGGTNGSSSYSFEYNKGPGQSAGRSVANKIKAKVNGMVDSGRKAADSLFSSVGNALKPATDTIGKAAEFVTGANANRRVEDAQKAYDEASRDMMVDNRSYVIGTKGTNAEHDAENWQQLADQERVMAKAYDTSANNRGLFDFDGKRADRYQQDQHEAQAREYANKAHELRTQVPKEYEADYRRLEEADRNLRAAEKARDENTFGGVVGNAAKDAGNWIGDRAKDVGNFATNAANDVGRTVGNAANAAGNWIGDRAKDVGDFATNAANAAGNAIGNAARDAGDWVGDRVQDVGNAVNGAAKDVANWGAGAVESGKNFFNNLFGGGNKETEQPTLSDPNERIITENIIPEQRITEQRIPEQRITENRIEEQRIAEKQAPGGFNSRPLTKEENEIELKRVNDRLNNIDDYYDHLRANNNPQWSNFTKQDIIDLLTKDRDHYQNEINQQQEAERARALSDKPDGVSDEFWREYTFNGGTREQYDAEMQRMRNQNANRQQSSNDMSDKPSNVSDEFWREYTFNGGTRDSYDREMSARKNSQNNQNSGALRQDVVGTVDTSRPYHFTYDPASGQTIVVYDDEKRR